MLEGISVVVPTKGRTQYVRETLSSLAIARGYFRKPTQVLVVDDSSQSEADVTKSLCLAYGAEYFAFRGGVSEKRNLGINKAVFPIVLFVDSDCRVDERILAEHTGCYDDDTTAGCLGLTEFVGKETIVSKTITEMAPFLPPHQFANHMAYAPWGPCTNISFRRDILRQVDGFAVLMPPREGSEDVDLGYRVRELGYRIKCNPSAVVFHPREAFGGWGSLVSRAFRWGRAEAHLLHRHKRNSYVDITKQTLVFGFLLVATVFASLASHRVTALYIPFLWLLVVLLLQGLLTSVSDGNRPSLRNIGCSFASVMVDSIYELGTVAECIYRRRLRLLPLKFVYEEHQLYYRSRRGMIRMWSFVFSFLVVCVIVSILG